MRVRACVRTCVCVCVCVRVSDLEFARFGRPAGSDRPRPIACARNGEPARVHDESAPARG